MWKVIGLLIVGLVLGALMSVQNTDVTAMERRLEIVEARLEGMEPTLRHRMELLDRTFFSQMMRLEELERTVYGRRFESPWEFPLPGQMVPEDRREAYF